MNIMYRFNTIFTFFNAFGFTVAKYNNYSGIEAVSIGIHGQIIFTDTQTNGDDPIKELAKGFCYMYNMHKTPKFILEKFLNIYKNGTLPELANYSKIFGAKHTEMAFMLMAHARRAFNDDVDVVEFLNYVVDIIREELINRLQGSRKIEIDDFKDYNVFDKCMHVSGVTTNNIADSPITPIRDIMTGAVEKNLNILKKDGGADKIINENIDRDSEVKIENKQPPEAEIKKPDKVFAKHKYAKVPIQITYRLKGDDALVNRSDFGYITSKGNIKSLYGINDNEERFIISISILPMTVQEFKGFLKKFNTNSASELISYMAFSHGGE